MKPANGDTVDVVETSDLLILRNLLKGKSGPENPAYRLTRYSSLSYTRRIPDPIEKFLTWLFNKRKGKQFKCVE